MRLRDVPPADLGNATQKPLDAFEEALGKLVDLIEPFVTLKRNGDPLAEPWDELTSAQATLAADIEGFGAEAVAHSRKWRNAARDNVGLNAARETLHSLASMRPAPQERPGQLTEGVPAILTILHSCYRFEQEHDDDKPGFGWGRN